LKKIAILQSNYIPWKGYFDIINMVDEFIFHDDLQYTKGDWRNRNKIKTNLDVKWLSIPIRQEKMSQLIKDTQVVDKRWAKKHWAIIKQNYSKARYFKTYKDFFEDLYLNNTELFLSQINYKFIFEINKILGINTTIRWSEEFDLIDGKSDKLLGICKDCNADIYLSGPAAKNYLDEGIFKTSNIKIEWMDYNNYPEYRQLFSPFEHSVTILDLIFNEGDNATKFMKSFN
jgi:hypothetical protein